MVVALSCAFALTEHEFTSIRLADSVVCAGLNPAAWRWPAASSLSSLFIWQPNVRIEYVLLVNLGLFVRQISSVGTIPSSRR